MVCVCVYDGDSHAQIRSVLRNRPAWGRGYNLVTAVDPINKESLQAKSMGSTCMYNYNYKDGSFTFKGWCFHVAVQASTVVQVRTVDTKHKHVM